MGRPRGSSTWKHHHLIRRDELGGVIEDKGIYHRRRVAWRQAEALDRDGVHFWRVMPCRTIHPGMTNRISA